MKPQALQDAIKAAALKKKQNGWKEPVVKQHKITSDEFKDLKEKTKTGSIAGSSMPSVPVPVPSAAPAFNVNAIQSLLDKQALAFKAEMKTILDEMKGSRAELAELKSHMKSLQSDVREMPSRSASKSDPTPTTPVATHDNSEVLDYLRDMMKELKAVKVELGELRQENRELRQYIKERDMNDSGIISTESDDVSRDLSEVSREIKLVRRQTDEIRRQLREKDEVERKLAEESKSRALEKVEEEKKVEEAPSTPKTPKKTLSNSSISVPGTPKSKVEAKLMPFGPETLYEHQRRDELLRDFIQKQEGPYTVDESKIKQVEGRNLVFFRKRIYMPKRLRREAVEYYCAEYEQDALEQLMKNCIWPTLEEDFKKMKC